MLAPTSSISAWLASAPFAIKMSIIYLFLALTAYWNITISVTNFVDFKTNGFSTYMKRGLTVNISAVDIHFIIVKQCDNIMDIAMSDCSKHNIVASLFYASNHLFQSFNKSIIRILEYNFYIDIFTF